MSMLESINSVSDRILSFSFTCASSNKRSVPQLSIIVCYSPTCSSEVETLNSFYADLQKTVDEVGQHAFLAILGDWNARLQLSTQSPWVYSNKPNRNSEYFSDLLSGNSFFSANTIFRKKKGKLYTYRGPSGVLSQIDHVTFRNKYRNSVKNCKALTFRPFQSDHRLVIASVRLSLRAKSTCKNSNPRYDWSGLRDSETLKKFRLVCTNRYSALSGASVDHKEKYTAFVAAVSSAAQQSLSVIKPIKKRVPWEDVEIKKARMLLKQAKAADRKKRTKNTMAQVASASLALSRQYTKNQEEFIRTQLDKIQSADESRKPTEAWQTINRLSGRKSKPSAKVKASSPQARLTGWKDHFEKLLNNEAPPSDNFTFRKVSDTLSNISIGDITFEEVLTASKAMKTGKASGVDGIPPEVLRDPDMLKLLHPILNQVYNTCQAPKEFLLNRVIVLPKKGDLSQYGSYRGISLMSCAAKLFNRVILNRIKKPVDKLLRNNQNGFREGRSTLEPILVLRRLVEAISVKKDASLCAVFVDFTKASILYTEIGCLLFSMRTVFLLP